MLLAEQAKPEAALQAKMPDPADVFKRAESLFDQGRYDQALELAERVTAVRPGHGAAWRLAGYCRQELGDGAKALEAFRRALELEPGDAELAAWIEELERVRAPQGTGP